MKKDNQKHQQQFKKTIKENSGTITEKKKSSSLLIILAFCFPVLLYLQTINFGFTNFDDEDIISKNFSFLSNIGNAKQAFLTDAFIDKSSSFYRPLQTLSFMADIKVSGGNNTWMYHLSNILLLGLIACSLFLLLKRFSIPQKLALLSTLIYCAHPLFISTIAFIPTRGELLLTFFSLLSFIFFIDFIRKGKIIFLFLNWVAFTIALFCKETAAFLPLLFTLYYFTFPNVKRIEKKYFFIILFYAVSGIFWFWLRTKAIGGISNRNDVFELIPFLSNLRTIPECIAKFFLPFDIAPIPCYSILKTLTGLVIIVIICILFFKNKERSAKEKIFCFSWFLFLMLPSMLYKHPYMDYLDHRFFLPLIGILFFALFLFPKKWLIKGDIKRSWLLIVVLLFLSSYTFIKSRSYSDPITFYNSAASQNPNSATAFINLGYIKNAGNDFQGAIDDYNKAIDICPKYPEAYNNRGNAKANLGDESGAIDDYNKAISLKQNYSEAYNNRGIAKAIAGDNTGAVMDFNKAVAIIPDYTDAYCNRAITKYTLKDFTGVIDDCEMMLKLNPNDEKALNLKAKAQLELQKIK